MLSSHLLVSDGLELPAGHNRSIPTLARCGGRSVRVVRDLLVAGRHEPGLRVRSTAFGVITQNLHSTIKNL